MRSIPILPTIIVVAAVLTMIALGIWQLGRADEKEALLAEYERKSQLQDVVELSFGNSGWVYRTVRIKCPKPRAWQAVAGRNIQGQVGYVHRYECAKYRRWLQPNNSIIETTYADIGWSMSPNEPNFTGGEIEGLLVGRDDKYKVVATDPYAGLEKVAKPDPNDLPNNHLAYAGQWFFFAITALAIYFLALRKRSAEARRRGENGAA